MFAAAHVDGLPLGPPFGADFLGYLPECLVAVFAVVVDGDVLGSIHLPDLPVSDVVPAVVHALYNHRHMLPGRGREREHGVVLIIDGLYHEYVPEKALDAVELEVVFPLSGRHLFGAVPLGEPVALPLEVDVIIDIQFHMLIQGEGECQDVVALYLLGLCRAVVGRKLRPGIARPVVYCQNHV